MPSNGKEYDRKYNANRQRYRRYSAHDQAKSRRRSDRVRMEALRVYSGMEHPRCMCECGCTEDRFPLLQIDHINNDGAAHRRMLKRIYGGQQWYFKLKKLGWPKNPPLRVLCVKCNIGRQYNNGQCVELGIIPSGSRRQAKCKTTMIPTPEPPQEPLFSYIEQADASGGEPRSVKRLHE